MKGKPYRRHWHVAGVLGLLCLLLAACGGQRQSETTAETFSLMSYNLRQFLYTDRDNDGQRDDFKPESEVVPLLALIRQEAPDILAVQELGDADTLVLLQQRLRDSGLDFPYADHLAGPNPHATLGILSRHPIVLSDPLTNLFYSIQNRNLTVQRGFQQVDIAVGGTFTVRVINVHLKSKVFHEAGQTEMRRNEARLLGAQIRRFSARTPDRPIVLCGDFNDSHQSAALKEIQQQTDLTDLLITDRYGDLWTHFYAKEQAYARIDYIFVNPAMRARWVPEKSFIVRDSRTSAASDHRPLVATFRMND